MSDKDARTPMRANDPEQAADRIGELLRASGRRPPIPEARAARIEHAARATWEQELALRARRLRSWAALAAAAVVVAGAGLMLRGRLAPPEVAVPMGRVEIATGDAWSRRAGEERTIVPARLRAGDAVAVGAELTTTGEGRVALRLASGASVRLDRGTRLRLLSLRALALEVGAAYVDSGSRPGVAGDSIEVRTAFGAVHDVGTQFEVRVTDTSLRVRVREGAVTVASGDASYPADAGVELTIDSAGRTQHNPVDPFGAEWAWSEAVASFGGLEGRTLREFLDWYARERGVRLELAGDGLASAAGTIVLGGSIEGMTLEEAIDSVLATAAMHREEREGSLRVVRNDAIAQP